MSDEELIQEIQQLFGELGLLPKNIDKQRGIDSAKKVLSENRILDPDLINLVMETSFGYSEFQQVSYYDSDVGFYENGFSFQESMPLIPQMSSPLYGIALGEFIAGMFPLFANPDIVPTFLSLGAGAGFLDYDLIQHISRPEFEIEEGQEYTENMRDKSEFIVSDVTENSQELLANELAPLIHQNNLDQRIMIGQVDAMDFDFSKENVGKRPFLITYTNELIDALPTEPIIKVDGVIYAVKLVPNLIDNSEISEKLKPLSERLENKRVISKQDAKKYIEKGEIDNLAYVPVLIPLEHDSDLHSKVRQLNSVSNINSPGFNGIYPVHIGLDGLYSSLRKSSEHGILFIVDYHCGMDKGMHNYNKALNVFNWLRTGQEDLDFKIDPDQIIEVARKYGMRTITNDIFSEILEKSTPLMEAFLQPQQIERAVKINKGTPGNLEQNLMHMMMSIAMSVNAAKGYKFITLAY